jgi:hypothetical protein
MRSSGGTEGSSLSKLAMQRRQSGAKASHATSLSGPADPAAIEYQTRPHSVFGHQRASVRATTS